MTPDIDRFALQVGGIAFPLITKRSVNFHAYRIFFGAGYPSAIEQDLLLVMSQSYWDVVEAATYAPHLVTDPLPGSRAKRVLYQVGLHDAQVPNIASDIAARTMGLSHLGPAPYVPWDIESGEGPLDSAYVIFDMGVEPLPAGCVAADRDNAVHEGLRRLASVQAQLAEFFRPDGRVQVVCDGVCDPD
jgi:hypothetical protein